MHHAPQALVSLPREFSQEAPRRRRLRAAAQTRFRPSAADGSPAGHRSRTAKVARLGIIGLAAVFLAGCGTLQRDADDRAAQVADYSVPEGVSSAIASSGASTPDERVRATLQWFTDPYLTVAETQGSTWDATPRGGTKIEVGVFKAMESGSFFPPEAGKTAIGLACRVYDVAEAVTATAVECSDRLREEQESQNDMVNSSQP